MGSASMGRRLHVPLWDGAKNSSPFQGEEILLIPVLSLSTRVFLPLGEAVGRVPAPAAFLLCLTGETRKLWVGPGPTGCYCVRGWERSREDEFCALNT